MTYTKLLTLPNKVVSHFAKAYRGKLTALIAK